MQNDNQPVVSLILMNKTRAASKPKATNQTEMEEEHGFLFILIEFSQTRVLPIYFYALSIMR